MAVTIYHNPRCSKSRQTLAILEEKGVDHDVVEYLTNPPSQAELKRVLTKLGLKPADIIRKKEAKAAGIDASTMNDADLIKAMVANPIVIERPIVVTDDQAVMGRPPENVLTII